ncbi:MAG: hypothetical protein M3Q65_24315, partial [Chloroflexota bacterium]|nr:hypothetical protein [Chloroflexota bacterium]
MLPEIIEYSGLLYFSSLSNDQLTATKMLAEAAGLEIEVGPRSLELAYSGRDTDRKVVKFIGKLAEIVGDAAGEITCTLNWEHADPSFEFYSIRDGKVFLQRGWILREKSEAV